MTRANRRRRYRASCWVSRKQREDSRKKWRRIFEFFKEPSWRRATQKVDYQLTINAHPFMLAIERLYVRDVALCVSTRTAKRLRRSPWHLS